jgi:galactonate dehydratase
MLSQRWRSRPVCRSPSAKRWPAELPSWRCSHRRAIDLAIVDISWVGGLTEAKVIAALADTYRLPFAAHDCTGPVVLTASTHLSMHVQNAYLQESVRAYYTGWYQDLLTELPTIKDGHIAPQPGPGLGTALQPDLRSRKGVHRRVSSLDRAH